MGVRHVLSRLAVDLELILRQCVVVSRAIEIDFPDDLVSFELPRGVQHRLQNLLDKQDEGSPLTAEERSEAEGLVSLSETLTLLRLRAKRISQG